MNTISFPQWYSHISRTALHRYRRFSRAKTLYWTSAFHILRSSLKWGFLALLQMSFHPHSWCLLLHAVHRECHLPNAALLPHLLLQSSTDSFVGATGQVTWPRRSFSDVLSQVISYFRKGNSLLSLPSYECYATCFAQSLGQSESWRDTKPSAISSKTFT